MSLIKNVDIPAELAAQLIQTQFPEITISSIKQMGEGWDNVVYLVNDNVIFRFPKWDWASESIFRETRVLPLIRTCLKPDIPDFKYVGKPSDAFDKYFVGYTPIQGSFLYDYVYNELSTEQKDSIHKDIAELLSALHAISLDLLQDCDIEDWGMKEEYEEYYAHISTHAFAFLTKEEQGFITSHFNWYLNDDSNFLNPAVLRHNDLSGDHILLNPEQNRVVGIIDWGDLRIGEADYDLYPLYEDHGVDFIKGVLRYYPHKDHERLFKKLEFFRICNAFGEILYGMSDEVDADYIHEVRNRIWKKA